MTRYAACRPPPRLQFQLTASVHHRPQEPAMTWTTPSFTEMRFGFEVTMYIQTR